jgi:thiol peroxidase
MLSDHRSADFGQAYGCLMKEVRLLRRAAFVIDRPGRIAYAEYLPVLGQEPNYAALLAAARKVLAG